ncbi:MAG: 8-oxo-dGTP pyrophosphatase MutT (NUDIX family) [Rickettsiales bacterium]|jgi:8-oxo-dGTP pyrophosphatase MutT (NUDIX family)
MIPFLITLSLRERTKIKDFSDIIFHLKMGNSMSKQKTKNSLKTPFWKDRLLPRLLILLIIAGYLSYGKIYVVIDEFFMEIPDCNLSENLKTDKSKANAGCLIIEEGKILLVKSRNHYSIPAGTSAKGESAACTAHRETFEESGVNVKVLKRLHVADNGFVIFLCRLVSEVDLNYRKKYEIDEVVLRKIDEIQNYRYEGQLDLIKHYFEENQ